MNYKEILKLVDYPEEVLVLDFETFFTQNYSLKKMSTIEYIKHRMFQFTGVGYQFINNPVVGDMQIQFHGGKEAVYETIGVLQGSIGLDFDSITTVVKNAKFDIVILQTKFGIVPKYIIDIDDLLRHFDARMSHKMKDVTKMFGLQDKGKTSDFINLHHGDMNEVQKRALSEYCKNDVKIETALFKILLPLLSNPIIEIQLARHTLDLFLNPRIKFDFKKAIKLKQKMQEKLNLTLEKIDWVLEYEN